MWLLPGQLPVIPEIDVGEKARADVLLVRKNIFSTREKAKAALMQGAVAFDGKVISKAGTLVSVNSVIEVKKPPKYVSRGGFKIEKALSEFDIDLEDKIVIDVGVSTGGFTDCLLKNGARRIIAVDVGYGQIDLKLRNDPRVYLIERTNIRYLESDDIPEKADLAAIDISFISVLKILENLSNLLKKKSKLLILLKPQFEAGKDSVGKKGVIKDAKVHEKVITKVTEGICKRNYRILGIAYSPILGAKGNIEFWIYAEENKGKKEVISEEEISRIVKQAHQELLR